jgi:hypothetical protein
MPSGTSDSPVTNKTEFMRWLDAHETAIPSLSSRLREYKAQKPDGENFGAWMRVRYLPEFCGVYQSYWLTHPSLHTQVYSEVAAGS